MKKKSLWVMFFWGLLAGNLASAQTANLVDTLRGAQQDGTNGGDFIGDGFGNHVAVDDDWLIVGAPRESIDLDDSGDFFGPGERRVGAVYIYRRTASGPVLSQKIVGDGDSEVTELRVDQLHQLVGVDQLRGGSHTRGHVSAQGHQPVDTGLLIGSQ